MFGAFNKESGRLDGKAENSKVALQIAAYFANVFPFQPSLLSNVRVYILECNAGLVNVQEAT